MGQIRGLPSRQQHRRSYSGGVPHRRKDDAYATQCPNAHKGYTTQRVATEAGKKNDYSDDVAHKLQELRAQENTEHDVKLQPSNTPATSDTCLNPPRPNTLGDCAQAATQLLDNMNKVGKSLQILLNDVNKAQKFLQAQMGAAQGRAPGA